MKSGRQVMKEIRDRLNRPCQTCGHPMHQHDLEDPHPCQTCLDNVMGERCWAYVRPDHSDG